MQISQRQARLYRKQVLEMKDIFSRQRNRWSSDWSPGWVKIETILLSDTSFAKITTARLLGHAIVIVPQGDSNKVMLYADKL